MATSMDFSYFNSAPLPYQLQPAAVDGDFHFEDYGNVQTTEPFNPAFSHFQDAFHYDPSLQTPGRSHSRPILSQTPISPSFDTPFLNDDGRPRSSSEEKDHANPQQNKRKAQNRAAQRAFRERKEKHLKDLEAQLAVLQQQSMKLDSDNQQLREQLAKVATENEILRASTGQSIEDDIFGHRTKSEKEGYISSRAKFSPLQRIVVDDSSGEPLLNAGQTWDYVQAHEMYQKGLVDVGDVCERLKKLARCHGQGPVFRECDIRQTIKESAVAGGRDELI